MEDILEQERFKPIEIAPAIKNHLISVTCIKQDGNPIVLDNSKLPLFISKLAKFADGDDRAVVKEIIEMAYKSDMQTIDAIEEILQDFIIIKRPTDETGK